MKNKGTLLTYFDDTVSELKTFNPTSLPTFVEKAEMLILKHNNTNIDIRKKFALGDYHFVPELQQKILLGLQKIKLKIANVPDFQSDIYHKCIVKIDADASLEELVKRGQYGIWGKALTSEKYPKPIWEAKELELLIIEFGELSRPPYESVVGRVTQKFGHLGRFAGAYELAHLGWQHPTIQERFIELYGIASQEHIRDHTWATSSPVWRVPMLTYAYEQAGPKIRGFYTKDEGSMWYNHDFCSTGFVIVKK